MAKDDSQIYATESENFKKEVKIKAQSHSYKIQLTRFYT